VLDDEYKMVIVLYRNNNLEMSKIWIKYEFPNTNINFQSIVSTRCILATIGWLTGILEDSRLINKTPYRYAKYGWFKKAL